LPDILFEWKQCLLDRILLNSSRDGAFQESYAPFLSKNGPSFFLAGYDKAPQKKEFLKTTTANILNAAERDIHRAISLLSQFAKKIKEDYPLLELKEKEKDEKLVGAIDRWERDAKENLEILQAEEGHLHDHSSKQFLDEVLVPVSELQPRKLLHKILMSERYTAETFKEEIRGLIKEGEALKKKYSQGTRMNFVVFIDELNTSSILGVVKEVFMDRTIDGECLPQNLFFIGAINPPTQRKPQEAQQGDTISEFVVKHLPPSMEVLILDFATLTSRQEEVFLNIYVGETPHFQQTFKSQVLLLKHNPKKKRINEKKINCLF